MENPRYFNGVKSRLETTTAKFEKRVKPDILLKVRSCSDLHRKRVIKSDNSEVTVNVRNPFKIHSKFKPPIYKPDAKPKIACSAKITLRLGILKRCL